MGSEKIRASPVTQNPDQQTHDVGGSRQQQQTSRARALSQVSHVRSFYIEFKVDRFRHAMQQKKRIYY